MNIVLVSLAFAVIWILTLFVPLSFYNYRFITIFIVLGCFTYIFYQSRRSQNSGITKLLFRIMSLLSIIGLFLFIWLNGFIGLVFQSFGIR